MFHRFLRSIAFFAFAMYASSAVAGGTESNGVTPCKVIEYYYRIGCPHCEKAGAFLAQLKKERSDIEIREYDVFDKAYGNRRFVELNRRHGIERPGVPSFLICGHFIVGFDRAETSGIRIKRLLQAQQAGHDPVDVPLASLPVLGDIKASGFGLPVFTLIIGLIDGFNPCAMWVLLFLLTLLVNLRSRSRILIVAGTFVLVSGFVYFAFMAAWLNLYLIIGYSSSIQMIVGVLAMTIGLVHIKDYFAFQKGISLNIPESGKPGLYAKMRNVVYADNLLGSLTAVVVLAVLVNFLELMCTAGLPAAYTRILTLQMLSPLRYYGYLALYNLAYIFDDALMVAVAVYTLNRTRLQEKGGRLLKLISGLTVFVLGLYILVVFE